MPRHTSRKRSCMRAIASKLENSESMDIDEDDYVSSYSVNNVDKKTTIKKLVGHLVRADNGKKRNVSLLVFTLLK